MVCISLLLVACSGQPHKPPAMLALEIEATADLNLGPGGQPLPVVLRIYDLERQGGFMGADLYALLDNEAALLGPDLIAREELMLRPSQRLRSARPLDPKAAYLGVLAAYRDIDRSRWRAVVPLRAGQDNAIRIVVGAAAVSAYAQ